MMNIYVKKYWWAGLLALLGLVLLCWVLFAFVVPALAPQASAGMGQQPKTQQMEKVVTETVKVEVTREVRVEVPVTETVILTKEVAAPPAALVQSAALNGTVWTPEQKCEWLRVNFPQTTASVQKFGATLGNVPTQRIATHIYHCDADTSVFDGFILLGPNEGFSGAVMLTVPQNGAIDSYPVECGARYSMTPILVNSMPQNCDDTYRAVDGTVTAQRMTYWPWNDDNPPVGAVAVASTASAVTDTTTTVVSSQAVTTTTSTTACEQPADLATRMGWANKDWADKKFGGLRVELTITGQLPPKWEALSSGRKIGENDTDRSMVIGVWTIYPPYSCREALGFSK